jgi:Arc/MetJ-type ribon-helix-helix transcriptional regulator
MMKGMTKVKIAVSLPQEQVVSAKQAVADGLARSVSGYVSDALRQYDQRNQLTRYLDELDEKYGPPGPEAEAWADEVMREAEQLRSRGGYPRR